MNLFSGDDPLAYEGYARNVLFHGLLMPNGAEVGHGAAYYHYPLYSYGLALAHVVFGEQFSSVVFLNILSVCAILLLCWHLGWRRLPTWAAVCAGLAMGWFIVRHLMPYTYTAFSDNAFVSLVFVALLASVTALECGERRWWVLAGVSAAWAAAARPSFLTYLGLFPVAVVVLSDERWRKRSFRSAGLFLVGVLLGLSPFALRNWIMTRKLVLLVNSWIQIPYFLYPWDRPNPVSSVSGLPEAITKAVDIILTQPAMVADIEWRKVAFTLGWTQAGPAAVGAHWDLLLLTCLFAAAVLLGKIPRRLTLVVVAFAVSHVAAMVLAAPWTYGYKTILPLHAVFLFGSVYLLAGAVKSGIGERESDVASAPSARSQG